MINPFEIIEERLASMEALLSSLLDNSITDNKSEIDIHFNVEELMNFLRCSKSTVYKYMSEGLPSFGTGRTKLFSKKEVLVYLKKQKTKNKK